ncbi:universal stress protein [Microbacterium sp. NPDC056003]|jgi:nucleotide-binding universal stress UspA family protein|uniref:universal stress protein n=1 Tax=Microbacterium sp. NPDC056003 TaxID=3345676 RepID=UPI0035DB29C7
MERVVVGYDGSPAADSALEWVSDRALRGDRRVEVVLVARRLSFGPADEDRTLDRAETLLASRVPGLPVETRRLGGSMPDTLVDAADGAGLLVVGVDRGHPIRAALHGWQSQRLSVRSPVPTCVVPRGWQSNGGPVIVGLGEDGSSDGALEFAAAEAEASSAALVVVHAWPPSGMPRGGGESAMEESRVMHRRHADDAAARARRAHPGLTVRVEVAEHDAASALERAADGSAMVVIGTHGRGILTGGLVGSVALDLIGQASAPVCVVPLTPVASPDARGGRARTSTGGDGGRDAGSPEPAA